MPETMNPIQKKIAEGMNPLVAYLTNATCGEACWEAREDVCRCSCGGKNHGCMRRPDGVRPERTAKIDGVRYILRGIDAGSYETARAINKEHGAFTIGNSSYKFYKTETDPGAPARLKMATDSQVAAWPELAAYRGADSRFWTDDQDKKHYVDKPYLLWVREDLKIG